MANKKIISLSELKNGAYIKLIHGDTTHYGIVQKAHSYKEGQTRVDLKIYPIFDEYDSIGATLGNTPTEEGKFLSVADSSWSPMQFFTTTKRTIQKIAEEQKIALLHAINEKAKNKRKEVRALFKSMEF